MTSLVHLVVGGHDVNGAILDPAQHQAAGIRQVLWVVLYDVSGSQNLQDVVHTDPSLEHPPQGMDPKDEAGLRCHARASISALEPGVTIRSE